MDSYIKILLIHGGADADSEGEIVNNAHMYAFLWEALEVLDRLSEIIYLSAELYKLVGKNMFIPFILEV